MKNFIIECPKARIRELSITIGNPGSVSVSLDLFDIDDNYVGSVLLNSKNAKNSSYHVSQKVADTITDLFTLIENDISEDDTISFVTHND